MYHQLKGKTYTEYEEFKTQGLSKLAQETFKDALINICKTALATPDLLK